VYAVGRSAWRLVRAGLSGALCSIGFVVSRGALVLGSPFLYAAAFGISISYLWFVSRVSALFVFCTLGFAVVVSVVLDFGGGSSLDGGIWLVSVLF